MRWAFLLLLCVAARPVSSWEQTGLASWYGGEFHGRLTANGEVFDTHQMTAAHKRLPFGTLVDVTDLETGRTVRVRINDRGPFVEGRIIDLSYAAAAELDMVRRGTARVRLKVHEFDELKVTYDIQCGAFRNLENAAAMKTRLEALGYSPRAVLHNQGLTRIVLEDIPEDMTWDVVQKLEGNGITQIQVKQN